MMPMFLTVYLSNNDQHFTEVPVTPETLSRDVVELCKEPGEAECHLAEMWRGAERVVGDGERMMEILQHWGQQRGEVRFILRHERAPGREPGGCRDQAKRNMLKASVERAMENGVCGPRVDVTLSDLQDMAARQQLQINAQQQLLASKEQRLRYLKQQEQRVEQRAAQQQATEQERLRQLRENAHNQEAKLRRVRALRGQVEQKRASNSKLVEEIEQITGLFQQKQRDLLLAVSRVEELSQQLESIRSSRMEPPPPHITTSSSSSSSAVELERLYKELQLRNKLNQEQSGRLQQQRETLNKRNVEVDTMDRRVAELRQRLWKKKAALQQKENLPAAPDGQGLQQQCVSSRVAAVGPYIQSSSNGGPQGPPVPARHEVLVKPAYPDGTATLPMPESSLKPPPRPLKPASGFQTSSKARPSDWSSSSLDSGGGGYGHAHGHASTLPRMTSLSCQDAEAEKDVPPPVPARTNHNTDNHLRDSQVSGKGLVKPSKAPVPPPVPSKPKQFSSQQQQQQQQQAFSSKPPYSTGTFPGKAKPAGPSLGLGLGPPSSHLRAPPPPLPAHHSHTLPLPPKQDTAPPAATVRPFTPDPVEAPAPPPPPPVLQKPQMVAASSIYSMYTQQSTPGKIYAQPGQSTLTRQARVYGKPVLPPTGGQQSASSDGSVGVSVGSSAIDGGELELSCLLGGPGPGEGAPPPPPETSERAAPRPLSPTKLLPFVSVAHRNPTDADLEALRRRLHHAPRPLKKRSSITEPEGPAGPNIQKLLYQKTTLAAMETIPADAVAATATASAYQAYYDGTPEDEGTGGSEHARGTAPGLGLNPADMHNNQSSLAAPPLPPRSPVLDPASSGHALPPPLEEEELGGEACPPSSSSSPPITVVHEPYMMEEYPPYPPPPYPSCGGEQDPAGEDGLSMKAPEVTGQVTLPPGKRTNLRKVGSERIDHGMRVKFNPLALLLDSSLEGEYDLVQRVIYDVADPSMPNDEGITALHNAVCAGHTEIVKFLVQFGVNVNAADSDGWTPLHCAASCNNVQVCKFLVESGAAVFATTYSDMQTAADKCEEMEDGYAQCSQFLYGVQEKMGVMNRGVVYALWDYEAGGEEDELGFLEGDCMTVLRREDQLETDWWWARCGDQEGYIPRNLLGLYLRIRPRQRSLA